MSRVSSVKIDDKLAMKLYNEKMGWREIGRILSLHPFTVAEYFRKKGLPAHNPVGGTRTWDTDKLDQILWCGATVKQASKELGVSQSTIYSYLRKKNNGNKVRELPF